MSGRADIAARLGPDVAAVLERLGPAVVDAVRITGLPDRTTGRATFRVVLEDGRVLKVRRLIRAAKGVRFARLLEALASPRFPPVLALDGRVCVEPWVEGTPLSELPLRREQLREAAEILAAVHATARVGQRALGPRPTGPLLRRTARRLVALGDAGALTRREVAALVEAAVRAAPARAAVGVVHTDFCAENLVQDLAGRLVVVDNEGLRVDFLDFDLARTWYRWPMPAADWSVFLAHYTGSRRSLPEPGSEPFWRIAVLAKSCQLRASRGTDRESAPRARLRAIVAGLAGA
jgi:hypothetical protein